jgi:GNAT superfamily N-acetyltransferase
MPRNNADFQGITISHKVIAPDRKDNTIEIEAHHPEHGKIGRLGLVNHMAGIGRQVGTVEVHPDFQRKGVATALWNYAKDNGFNPVHSTNRSPLGKKWAEAVGD